MISKRCVLPAVLVLILAGCTWGTAEEPTAGRSDYDYTVREKEDVISQMGRIVNNRERLDDFANRVTDAQRVVHYTIEGDPIFQEVRYTADGIELRHDTTRDKFGNPKVTTYACAKLNRVENETMLTYMLTGCQGERKEIELLRIPYDVGKQDAFEFILRYGYGRKNEVNTFDRKLVKDLLNGEVAIADEFKLTPEERQSVYKIMVLANYLAPKELSDRCDKKPYSSYELEVKINGGSRHYVWSECDTGKDGTAMTKLAQEILSLIQAKEAYRRLPPASGGVM